MIKEVNKKLPLSLNFSRNVTILGALQSNKKRK